MHQYWVVLSCSGLRMNFCHICKCGKMVFMHVQGFHQKKSKICYLAQKQDQDLESQVCTMITFTFPKLTIFYFCSSFLPGTWKIFAQHSWCYMLSEREIVTGPPWKVFLAPSVKAVELVKNPAWRSSALTHKHCVLSTPFVNCNKRALLRQRRTRKKTKKIKKKNSSHSPNDPKSTIDCRLFM